MALVNTMLFILSFLFAVSFCCVLVSTGNYLFTK